MNWAPSKRLPLLLLGLLRSAASVESQIVSYISMDKLLLSQEPTHLSRLQIQRQGTPGVDQIQRQGTPGMDQIQRQGNT